MNQELTTEQQIQARELWSALNNAPSACDLFIAREKLRCAPAPIRNAILEANISIWRCETLVGAEDVNPFD